MPYFNQDRYRIEVGKVLCFQGGKGDQRDFFLKPASSIALFDQAIIIPRGVEKLGYHMMMALAVGKKIDDRKRHKLARIMGYGASLHIYDRELLRISTRRGMPWIEAVGSDTFCPISDFTSSKEIDDPYDLEAYMEINGSEVLKGTTKEIGIDIESALEAVTKRITLYPGDLICLPIERGNGEIRSGDSIEAGISSIGVMRHLVRDQ